MAVVKNFPASASKCASIPDAIGIENCLLPFATSKAIKCLTEEDTDLRNKCVVKETVAAINSMPPDCVAKFKTKFNAIVETREIQLYGKSTFQINKEKQDTAEKNKKNKNSKTLTKPEVP